MTAALCLWNRKKEEVLNVCQLTPVNRRKEKLFGSNHLNIDCWQEWEESRILGPVCRGRGQERAGVMAEREGPAEHMCKCLSSQKRHHTLNSAHSSFLKNKANKQKSSNVLKDPGCVYIMKILGGLYQYNMHWSKIYEVWYIDNGILLIRKKEWNCTSCRDMDGPEPVV